MLIYNKQNINVCVSDTHKYKGNKVLHFLCFLTQGSGVSFVPFYATAS